MQTLGQTYISGPAADAIESLAAIMLLSLEIPIAALGCDFILGANLKAVASTLFRCYKKTRPFGLVFLVLQRRIRIKIESPGGAFIGQCKHWPMKGVDKVRRLENLFRSIQKYS